MDKKRWIRCTVTVMVLACLLAVTGCKKATNKQNEKNQGNGQVQNEQEGNQSVGQGKEQSSQEVNQMMVMIDDVVYSSNGTESDITGRCGVMDGEITSTVSESKIPTDDNQSNFGKGYGYQFVDANSIDVCMEDKWIRFDKATIVTNETKQGDLIENASPSTSAMSFYEFDGTKTECSWLFDAVKEQEIIDAINDLDALIVTNLNMEELEGPMYGISIGRTDGYEFGMTWWDGYCFLGDDVVYKVEIDFAKIKEEYSWQDQDEYSLLSMPNLYQMVTMDDGWNQKLLPKSEELQSNGLLLTLKELKGNQITVNLSNSSKEELYYGEYWSLQVLLDDTWYQIPVKENWGFNGIAYILPAGGEAEKTYDLKLYGDLPEGTYRLIVEGASVEFEVNGVME